MNSGVTTVEKLADRYRALLQAVSFSAFAHRHQIRKDNRTPYVAHPFRVCLIVRHVFGIDDPETLTVALLHDTIEDTTTDHDDLAERFGPRIARWVGCLSKDTRLPEAEREEAYFKALSDSELPVKISKLADLFDNLLDSQHLSENQRRRTLIRSKQYLTALAQGLPAEARSAFDCVTQLLQEFEAELSAHPE